MRISDWSSDVCSSDLHHADDRSCPCSFGTRSVLRGGLRRIGGLRGFTRRKQCGSDSPDPHFSSWELVLRIGCDPAERRKKFGTRQVKHVDQRRPPGPTPLGRKKAHPQSFRHPPPRDRKNMQTEKESE